MISLINNILSKFTGVRVLLLGDIMLDKYVYGDIERISPESPVPVLRHREEKNMLGGAGNVYRNLIALSGKQHVFLSATGEDQYFDIIKNLLDDTGKYYLFTEPQRNTTVKTRLIAQNQQTIRYDIETTFPLNEELYKNILSVYMEELESCDVVVLSDYNKGFFCKDFLQAIIKLAKDAGKPVLIDPKGRDFSVYSGADYIKPNRKELSESAGFSVKTTDDVIKAARSLCSRHSIGGVIATLSEDGMIYVPASGEVIHKKLEHNPEVFDVSGAGDTALAVLALCLASGVQITQALHIANITAQIAISKAGTATVTQDEIIHYVHRHLSEDTSEDLFEKIVTLPQAKKFIPIWKNEGDDICFTNGCFDLLHYGHISSFLQAKKYCDRLIVALNSDSSVRKNKGPMRPIQDQKTRACILAVLQCVDLVIIFDEDTALNTVKELHPDIIAKEGYALENWAEARYVQSYGGRVVFLKRESGYSTSELVGKISVFKEPA